MKLDYFRYQAKERVTYYPNGTGSGSQIEAVIFRVPLSVTQGNLIHSATLYIPRGSDAGEIETVNKGIDEIALRVDPYGPTVRALVTRLVESDGYVWKLEVTK